MTPFNFNFINFIASGNSRTKYKTQNEILCKRRPKEKTISLYNFLSPK